MLIKCTIKGVTPLLQNRFTEEAQIKVSNGTVGAMRGKQPLPREQAEQKTYRDINGSPMLPGPNLFAAIIEAGKFIKAGKSKLTTMRSSLIPAGLAISEAELPITPAKWEVDSRSVVIPATGGRIMCHRPRFDEWQIKFTLDIDESIFGQELIRELIDIAGQRVGIGDFRPSRKGPFGRFVVVLWKEHKI